MYRTQLQTTLALLLVVTFTLPAFAQRDWIWWESEISDPWNGVPLRQGWHVEWYRGGEGRYEGQNVGEVAFIWSDCRNTDRGVFLQVVGTDGNLKFEDQGLRISDNDNRQEDPVVWPARDGGWFVGWKEHSADTLGDIHCTKIDVDGERLWGDTELGVTVCNVDHCIQEDIRIVEDVGGGCILAWRDKRRGDDGDIFAMHVLSNGQNDPNWPENGRVVVAEAGAQTQHTADSDGEGGMIIAWKDGRIDDIDNIWAQRITPVGQPLWGDDRGILVCNSDAQQEDPKLCPDGSHGAFITWVDNRNLDESNKDIYAQRISANGQLLWGDAGTPLCAVAQEQIGNRIIISRNGAAIVMWEDKRNDGSTYDIYSQRISGVDEMTTEWNPATGVPVVTADRDQSAGRLFADYAGGAYYVWEDVRELGMPETDIYAQHLNDNGSPTWGDSLIVCRIPGAQSAPLIRRTTDGGAVMAWGDSRNGSKGIYAQRLNRVGQAQWDENGIALVDSVDGVAQEVKLLSRFDNYFNVVWLDGRRGADGAVPYIQQCRDAGNHLETMLANDGIPVLTGTNGGVAIIDAVNDDEGGTFVVWEDHRAGNDRFSIYAQHVSSEGELLWDETGLLVSKEDHNFECAAPKVCYDDNGGIYVAWKGDTEEAWVNIFMQHINTNGDKLWSENEEMHRITFSTKDETLESLISDGYGGAVLAWQADDTITDFDLWAQRVDADGNLLWGDGENGIVICNAPLKQAESQIIHHQNGYAMVWTDSRDEEESGKDIYGQFINPDGSFRWIENGAVICGFEDNQDSPAIAIDNETHIWVVWVDYRYNSGNRKLDIYIQKVSSRPTDSNRVITRLDNINGVAVCSAQDNQINPQVVHDLSNGVWVVWEDKRTGIHSDIYGTHLDTDGHPMGYWSDNGEVICDAFHNQIKPKAVILSRMNYGISGIVTAWIDMRATGKDHKNNIFTQRVCDYNRLSADRPRRIVPHGYALEEAHPNPFNSQSIITYVTPKDNYVRLSLYDITGRYIRQLTSEWASAGRHQVVINGEDLAAGVYVVRFEAGGMEFERKIQLVK